MTQIDIDSFNEKIRILALENATTYKGKANPKALIGKAVATFPEIKTDMKTYMSKIEEIVENINQLSYEEQIEELKQISPESLQKKEPKEKNKRDGLPELENTEEEVVVRFEPAPSGYLHIGHLFGIVANYETKLKYNGKIVLRIADTNPEGINKENYDKVIEDINWLCENDIDQIEYQSKRLPTYYKYLTTLIETGDAYVCECDPETFKAYTDAKEECPHAKQTIEEQKEKYNNFMNNKEAEGVIRFRADITHKNPALRSFSLARINNTPHPYADKNYHVWPTMNLAVAIDDSLMGITHVIRGKDHEINMERQKMVQKSLGLRTPNYFHFGRMKFTDLELSKSKLTKKILGGIYTGWDDPRVPSIVSYRKRGFQAEAMRKFILSLGISKRDSKISSDEFHKGLYYHNKQIIEPTSNHYFFVNSPISVQIKNPEDIDFDEITIQKHPNNPNHGWRHIPVSKEVLISSYDLNSFGKGDIIRLMHFGNFEVEELSPKIILKYHSKNYDKSIGIKKTIHFVNPFYCLDGEIILQDANVVKGFFEKTHLDIGEIIQFERFGFVRLSHIKKDGTYVFYFTNS